MVQTHQPVPSGEQLANQIRVIRHNQVCQKMQISSAKLFDMIAKKQFLQPFKLIPGGRAVGWLEQDVDHWILERKASSDQEVV